MYFRPGKQTHWTNHYLQAIPLNKTLQKVAVIIWYYTEFLHSHWLIDIVLIDSHGVTANLSFLDKDRWRFISYL